MVIAQLPYYKRPYVCLSFVRLQVKERFVGDLLYFVENKDIYKNTGDYIYDHCQN